MSQCVAVCCRVLQCVAVCCRVLQSFAVCCSVLQCVAVCCSMLQCVALCCSVLHCVAVCCNVLLAHCTVCLDSVLLCLAVCYAMCCVAFKERLFVDNVLKGLSTLQHNDKMQHTATHFNMLSRELPRVSAVVSCMRCGVLQCVLQKSLSTSHGERLEFVGGADGADRADISRVINCLLICDSIITFRTENRSRF